VESEETEKRLADTMKQVQELQVGLAIRSSVDSPIVVLVARSAGCW